MRNIVPHHATPVKTTSRALAALDGFDQLEHDIAELSNVHAMFVESGTNVHASFEPSTSVDLARAKQVLGKLQSLRRRFTGVNRTATQDEIATRIALLIAGFPNVKNADPLFAQLAAAAVAAKRPTSYVLMRACSGTVLEHEFLSIRALMKQVEAAQVRARRVRYLLHKFSLAEMIASEEEARPRRLAEFIKRRRENAAERAWDKRRFPGIPRWKNGKLVWSQT